MSQKSEEGEDAALQPIVAAGRNCWRIEHAHRASVVIDAADYYHLVHEAMEKAEQRILVLGWDFDTGVTMGRVLACDRKRLLNA